MLGQIFTYTHRVTYSECTVGNHIYHARYLDLLEAARGELCRHVDVSLVQLQEQDAIFPVIECRMRFENPARYDDVLTIEVTVTKMEKVRLNFSHRIRNQHGQAVLEAQTFHACTSVAGKPKRLPEALTSRLAPFVAAPSA